MHIVILVKLSALKWKLTEDVKVLKTELDTIMSILGLHETNRFHSHILNVCMSDLFRDKLWGKRKLPYNIFVNGNKEIQG